MANKKDAFENLNKQEGENSHMRKIKYIGIGAVR